MTQRDCKSLRLLGVAMEQTIAKPLYGLTPVPRVRIPPSPPVPTFSSTYNSLNRGLLPRFSRF